MSIIQPWPLASNEYVNPQPYDQRGCCWPWGPDGPIEKMPMRWAIEVFREDGGTMDPEWTPLALGFLYVCTNEAAVRIEEANWYSERTPSLLNVIFAQHLVPSGQWEISITMSTGTLPITIAQAVAIMQPGWNLAVDAEIPLTLVTGPAPQPDMMRLLPMVWWTSTVPYAFGP